MSDLAILRATDFTEVECEQLRDNLQPISDETNTRFIITNGDIDAMDERELKELLGHIVSILGYELDHE